MSDIVSRVGFRRPSERPLSFSSTSSALLKTRMRGLDPGIQWLAMRTIGPDSKRLDRSLASRWLWKKK